MQIKRYIYIYIPRSSQVTPFTPLRFFGFFYAPLFRGCEFTLFWVFRWFVRIYWILVIFVHKNLNTRTPTWNSPGCVLPRHFCSIFRTHMTPHNFEKLQTSACPEHPSQGFWSGVFKALWFVATAISKPASQIWFSIANFWSYHKSRGQNPIVCCKMSKNILS